MLIRQRNFTGASISQTQQLVAGIEQGPSDPETSAYPLCHCASLAGCHSRDNSLSVTACTSVDIFAIVYALLDRVEDCA